jgi:hypothetical protein
MPARLHRASAWPDEGRAPEESLRSRGCHYPPHSGGLIADSDLVGRNLLFSLRLTLRSGCVPAPTPTAHSAPTKSIIQPNRAPRRPTSGTVNCKKPRFRLIKSSGNLGRRDGPAFGPGMIHKYLSGKFYRGVRPTRRTRHRAVARLMESIQCKFVCGLLRAGVGWDVWPSGPATAVWLCGLRRWQHRRTSRALHRCRRTTRVLDLRPPHAG